METNTIPPAVLQSQVDAAVYSMAKETYKETATALVESLEVASLAGMGQNINIVA